MSGLFARRSGVAAVLAAVVVTLCGVTVPTVAFAQQARAATSASDNFQRANGGLGPNWTPITDGGMAIASQAATGTIPNGVSGDMWTADSFTSDQYAATQLTGAQLTGAQWIGAAVRVQAGGQSAYVGIYYWNNGTPVLELFLRCNGEWTELGGAALGGPLPGGTQLELTAVGDSLSFTVNGIQRIGVSEDTLTGGTPGIMASGAAKAASWTGGNAGFAINYQSTDSSGIATYTILSANDGYGPQTLRVIQPTNPAPGVAHNFLIVLPVEPGLDSDSFGDGLATMQSLNAQNQYNLTIVEPTFEMDAWDADNPADPHIQYETFLTQELVPWLRLHLAATGHEQVWLIGFSKSGLGAQDLILKHPGVFSLAASWDFPADMSSYDAHAGSAAVFGTDANFQANYRLTAAFVQAHAAPFEQSNRIWIGGWSLYGTDISDYDALLTSQGVLHTMAVPVPTVHTWSAGWVPNALASLYQDSIPGPLTVTTSSLPSAVSGSAYAQTFGVTGGNGADTFAVTGGALPAGLSLAPATGVISGTPTGSGISSFTIAATDTSSPVPQTASATLSITVEQVAQTISFTAPATGAVGGSAHLTATGGGSGNPVVFTVDASSGPRVCAVSGLNGSIVTYTATGNCVIGANQAGNAEYTSAPPVARRVTVVKATSATTLSVPGSTATYGREKALVFTVIVRPQLTGTPGGAVAVKAGKAVLCTAALASGKGTCSPVSATGLVPGSYSVTAAYQGDAAFAASVSGAKALKVLKEPTKSVLSVSASTIHFGNENHLIVTVTVSPQYSGTPGGTVAMKAGKITLCAGAVLSKGKVKCSPRTGTTLPAGTYSLVAVYSGNGAYTASTSSARTLKVVKP